MLRTKLIFLFVLSVINFSEATTTDSSFILETKTLQPYFSGYIGNGHFSLASTPLGITDAQSYMAKVYDHGTDDVPRIAVLPAWNGLDIYDGKQWLSKIKPDDTSIVSYSQKIDMYQAAIQTRYQWKNGDKVTDVEVESFVSRSNPNLAAIKLIVHPHYTGPMRINFWLHDWPTPNRMPLEKLDKYQPGLNERVPRIWYPGNMVVKDHHVKVTESGGRAFLVSSAEGKQTTVAQVMETRWPSGLKGITTNSSTDDATAQIQIEFQAEEKPYTFYKFVGIESSADARDPLKAATAAIDSMKARTYDFVFAEHTKAWQELWKTDIEVEGNPELQKLIHSMMFYVLCSVAKDSEFGIPPMGLSSGGYYGHIFWDSDTWMFPFLLVTHPELAKSMVMFRYRTLDAAQHKAKSLGFQGAMYPWEADEIGNETTPYFANQNALYEIHVTGDVALGQWQYYLATGDQKWLKEFGYPVIQQTANFWVSRATFNQEKNRYEIHNVVSVDEGLIGIGNDTYTNSIAKKNLEIAISASRVLGLREGLEWKKVADGLYIPYNEQESYHPPFENAPEEKLGTVVPLLTYPLQVPMSEQAKRNNLSHAVRLLEKEGHGAMMTITLFSVVAAELGDRELVTKLFPISYSGYLRPPFNTLAETPRNDGINFITGAGGFLQQIIFGFTGLRLTEDGLVKKYCPMLPSSVQKLRLKNFRVRNKQFDFETP
jgi:protein-glucosylgalactosylhydroxylysine glucosidase